MNEIIESVREEMNERTTRNFKATNVPLPVLKEFKTFCKEECGDVYAVGLQQLLKTKKLYENIIPLLSSIISELNELKNQINNPTTIREVKTFG